MPQNNLSIIHAYIYRNIREGANNYKYITEQTIYNTFKKTIHTAPKCVYKKIIEELIDLELIKRAHDDWFIVLDNKKAINKLKKLKGYIFPLIN